jgi:hypothetical protein
MAAQTNPGVHPGRRHGVEHYETGILMECDVHEDTWLQPGLPGNTIHHPEPLSSALLRVPESQGAPYQRRLALPRKLERKFGNPDRQH